MAVPANALPVFESGHRVARVARCGRYHPAGVPIVGGQRGATAGTPLLCVGGEEIFQFASSETELRKAAPSAV